MAKRLLLACLILTLSATSAWSAGTRDVHSPDGVDVWTVGDAGQIYRSLDGGTSWTTSTLGNKALRSIGTLGITAIVVGDSGKIWRSTDNGGTWGLSVVTGTPVLRAVAAIAPSTAYVAGESGTILKSVDGGASWSPQTSGTGERIDALAFTDDANGWAVGAGGTVLNTTDGGATWTPVAVPTGVDLYAVAAQGSRVWIVGARGAALQSTNGGASFSMLNLELDGLSDVRGVSLAGSDSVVIVGSGGSIRLSADDGASWTFPVHTLHAPASGVAMSGGKIWVVNDANAVIMSSSNGGSTWAMPAGASLSRSWQQKLSTGSTIRGNSLAVNPLNPRTLYAMLGDRVYVSRNEGETWTQQGNPVSSVSKTNAFVVSAKDSNVFVAAVGTPDRIVRSDNGGLTWTDRHTQAFGEYGLPLEMDPDEPDTMYFGPDNDRLYRSTDGGKTWSAYSTTVFRSPCDVVVIPGSPNSVVLVADGITGSGNGVLWRADNGSTSFSQRVTVAGSEIPTVSSGRLNKNRVFLTSWSSPAPHVSTDAGQTWNTVSGLSSVTSSWGTDISRDDPNVALVGRYSGGQTFITTDGGGTWTSVSHTGSNYAYYVRDRAMMLHESSNGVYKMNFAYSWTPGAVNKSVAVNVPNGGEVWPVGAVQTVRWNAANIALAVVEYRRAPGEAWVEIARVPGYVGAYDWTIPNDPTDLAKVRVRDGWTGTPSDTSDAAFSIPAPMTIGLDAPDGGEFWTYGTLHKVMWSSSGVDSVALEYQVGPGDPWQTIVASVPATPAEYDWLIPNDPSNVARVRVRTTTGAPMDSSANVFQIAVPQLNASPSGGGFGLVTIGTSLELPFQILNSGNGPMVISSITSNDPDWTVDRSSMSLNAGQKDTLHVTFSPQVAGVDTATISLVTNDPTGTHYIHVSGEGTATVSIGNDLPTAFALGQNEPNPFSGSTRIRYALPLRSLVQLEVFNVQGQHVATLVDGMQEPGRYSVEFGPRMRARHGRSLEAGVYFYRLKAGAFESTRKLLLLP